jgi:hypothetical protein
LARSPTDIKFLWSLIGQSLVGQNYSKSLKIIST